MQSELALQRDAIMICMNALESVSRIWLVGKMVHDLFEAILALDGFDRFLNEDTSPNGYSKLQSASKEDRLNSKYAVDLEASEKGIKSLSLTPALIAHMDAALKSASPPTKPAKNGNGSLQSHKSVPNVRPLAPRTKDDGNAQSSETSYKLPSTPGPTGLNAVEWCVTSTSLTDIPMMICSSAADFHTQAPIFRSTVSPKLSADTAANRRRVQKSIHVACSR